MTDLQERRNNNSREYLDSMKKHDVNCIKINVHNTVLHEKAKASKAIDLMFEGNDVVTEAYLKGGQRADIFVLDSGEAYEILVSESLEDFNKNKRAKYPCTVRAVGVKK